MPFCSTLKFELGHAETASSFPTFTRLFSAKQVAAKEDMSPEMDVRKRPSEKVGELGLSAKFKQVKQEENVEDDGGFPPRGKLEAEEMLNLFDPVVGSAPSFNVPTGDAATNQLTIFYSGSINVYDAVTPEKAHAIMLIAAAAAAAHVRNSKAVIDAPTAKPVLMRSPSLQSTSVASPKLQEELPIARRHSLQRFFEKRRGRIVTKAPDTMTKPADSKVAEESSSQLGGFTGSSGDQKAVSSPVTVNMT